MRKQGEATATRSAKECEVWGLAQTGQRMFCRMDVKSGYLDTTLFFSFDAFFYI